MLNSDFVKVNLKPKKGEPIHMNQFSDCVTSAGFKPATSLAVIKCTIQLCYEAEFKIANITIFFFHQRS